MELSETAKHAGLVHKLVRAFDTAGLQPSDLNKLAEDADLCKTLYGVMRGGWAQMTPVEFKIDCDALPDDPTHRNKRWFVDEHYAMHHRPQGQVVLTRKGENLYINNRKIALYFFETQPSDGPQVDASMLEKEIRGKDVLNANIMLFLCDNPHLIPEEWRWLGNRRHAQKDGLGIEFWGTTGVHYSGEPCVARMYFKNSEGVWHEGPNFSGKHPRSPSVVALLEAA